MDRTPTYPPDMPSKPAADPPPRWLLSIHEDSNANATLFRDGRPVFAVAEGRLNRRKYAAGFPTLAIEACLDFAAITMDDVDVIVPGNKHHFLPRVAGNLLPEGEHDYFGVQHKAWLYFQDRMARRGPLAWATERLSTAMLRRKLPKIAPIVDHHTAHAYSAWLTSGFDDALAITCDNMGDGWSSKVFRCSGGQAEFMHGSTALHSAGQFYGEIAQLLGFHNLNAGKVTGLAAHGDPNACYSHMEKLFALNDTRTGFVTPPLWKRTKTSGEHAKLKRFRPEDIAAAAQKRLEDVIVGYVAEAVRRAGVGKVVLAGGTFANVVVNQKVRELADVDEVYIHPAMTDQGISMGAGLAHLASLGCALNEPLETIYLGPGYDETAISRALAGSGLTFARPEKLAEEAADLLAAGHVVARFDGRLEYGPRALGNRSILYKADDPAVNDWLNRKLDRTEFMPFAPVTLEERADECYLGLDGGRFAARYMTMTFDVTDAMKSRSPGVVHLDGTARPQLIRAQDNPGYHAILRAFAAKTGTPTLINTSFNMHGEPIVCSPDDAIRAFKRSELPYLILGPYIVNGPQARPAGSADA